MILLLINVHTRIPCPSSCNHDLYQAKKKMLHCPQVQTFRGMGWYVRKSFSNFQSQSTTFGYADQFFFWVQKKVLIWGWGQGGGFPDLFIYSLTKVIDIAESNTTFHFSASYTSLALAQSLTCKGTSELHTEGGKMDTTELWHLLRDFVNYHLVKDSWAIGLLSGENERERKILKIRYEVEDEQYVILRDAILLICGYSEICTVILYSPELIREIKYAIRFLLSAS